MVLEAISECYGFLDDLVGAAPKAGLLQLTSHINKMIPKLS